MGSIRRGRLITSQIYHPRLLEYKFVKAPIFIVFKGNLILCLMIASLFGFISKPYTAHKVVYEAMKGITCPGG